MNPLTNGRMNKTLQDALEGGNITPEEFHDYICTRAFDVISNNAYRGFLVKVSPLMPSLANTRP